MTPKSDMQAVAEVALAAGNRALALFSKELVVDAKADGSPVTVADRSAEQLAREWIESRFPDDGIVGEEFGTVNPTAKRRWIIDPIDGTRSFVRGVPLWGTLIAVAEGDTIIAGAAYFPALREILVGARGEGCWWNDERCSVSSVSHISAATVLTTAAPFGGTDVRARWDELTRRSALSRTWGDCYGYCLVATGRAEVMVDPKVSEWDIAAFVPIIAEAGGVLSGWTTGSPFDGSAIATNSALADEAREILGAVSEAQKQ
jgi:histidinol phosphatase-like enzyme (inositol monophosphatase family)